MRSRYAEVFNVKIKKRHLDLPRGQIRRERLIGLEPMRTA